MNSTNSQIISIFADAIEFKTNEERQAFLDRACGGNADIRARIEALLKAHAEAGDFLKPRGEIPSVLETEALRRRAAAGELIGPYKLLEEIGEGGMGIVYMADQQAPVRRRVALKIIKPGMDTRQVIARFEAERQALAMMDHPNIARVFDAGTAPSGGPYFVMELVRGIAITDYCDQNNLTVTERLDLFVAVCQAVQHAHQKGVVHRDLKPSNVLVTLHDGRPVPKVIDFGVAKAINQQLTEKTLFTNFAQMVGTPLYMSPEQAEMSGLDVDTRSDVYSLGVLLYELLTGATPFDRARLRQAAYDEIRRIIREEEPPRPSTRISTLGETRTTMAAHRKVDPDRLSRMLRGELDWVVMKALEKDRTRRYETANGLARDIQRFLADQPVEACPPSTVYRFRKFARRNRVTLVTGALVAVSLVLGTVASTWQAIRATQAERLAEDRLVAETRARTEADVARAAETRQRRLAESERAAAERQRAIAEANFQKARNAVDEYFTLISENKLLDVPGLQPLRHELLDGALRFYQGSAVERTDDPAVLADLAATYIRVAVINQALGRNDDAVAAADKAVVVVDQLCSEFPEAKAQRRRLGGFWRGFRPVRQGSELPKDQEAALRILARLNATWRALSEEFPTDASFRNDLAAMCYLTGDLLATGHRPGPGVHYFEQAKAILRQLVDDDPDNPQYRADLARIHTYLGTHLPAVGRAGEAEAECRAGLALRERLVADFPDSPQYRRELAQSLRQCIRYVRSSDPDQAEKLLRRVVELTESLVHEYPNVALYHEELALSHFSVAEILLDRNELAGALKEARLAARLNPKDWQIHACLRNVLEKIGDTEQTLAVMRDNAQLYPDSEPAHHQYGLALKDHGRLDEAVGEFARGLEIIPTTPWSHYHIAEIRLRQNRLPEALDAARAAVRMGPTVPNFHAVLRRVLNAIGDEEQTLDAMREIAERSPDSEPAHHQYGLALKDHGRLDEAVREFARGIEIISDTHWNYFHIAEIRLRQDRLPEALEAARSAVRVAPTEDQMRACLFNVLRTLADTGDEQAQRELTSLRAELLRKLSTLTDPKQLNNNAWFLVTSPQVDPAVIDAGVQAAQRGCKLQPRNSMFLNTLGVAQYRQGDHEAAIESLERSRRFDDGAIALAGAMDGYFLAMAHAQLGHADIAEKWYRAADLWMALYAPTNDELRGFRREASDVLSIVAEPLADVALTPETERQLFELSRAADPDAGWPHRWMSARLIERGAWAEADEQLTLADRADEADGVLDGAGKTGAAWEYKRALLYLQTGQHDAYRRLCRASVAQALQSDDPRSAIVFKLGDGALEDYAPVLDSMEKLVRKDPDNRLALGVQAHLFYRSGQTEEAAKRLEQLVSSDDVASAHQPFNKLFLAMAHHDLGHAADAQRYFTEAADWIDKNGRAELQEGAVLSNPLDWTLRLELQLLRAEAEQLLGTTQAPTTTPTVEKPESGNG